MEHFLPVLGRLHPMLLHLPIGALFALALWEGVSWKQGGGVAPRLIVLFSAATAVIGAATGWILHREDGYGGGDLLEWHERLGVATALFALLAAWFHRQGKVGAYRKTLGATLLVLIPAGHFGAEMTHGAGFVLEPLTKKQQSASEKPGNGEELEADTLVMANFTDHVAPFLERKCNSCHGAKKQKGELRLDSQEAILSGGDTGPAILAGDLDQSELFFRMTLDLDDEDRMPPEHKRQPTEAEFALIETWILAGAPFEESFPMGDGLALPTEESQLEEDTLEPAAPEAIQNLRDHLIHVQTVSSATQELYVDFAAPSETIGNREVLKFLGPLHRHVAELSLARTKVSDKVMERLGDMPRIRRLDLRGTKVSDSGLSEFIENPTLQELILAQTQVSDSR